MDKSLQGKSLGDIGGFLYSLVLVALAVIGMTGILYHALAPSGSLRAWFGQIWATNPIFTALVIIGLLAVVLTARSHRLFFYRRPVRHGDLPLYLFVALGTFFAARWAMNGTF